MENSLFLADRLWERENLSLDRKSVARHWFKLLANNVRRRAAVVVVVMMWETVEAAADAAGAAPAAATLTPSSVHSRLAGRASAGCCEA